MTTTSKSPAAASPAAPTKTPDPKDVWGQLWDLALGDDEGGSATIEIDPADCGSVTLHFRDGSSGAWYWHDGGWQPCSEISTSPGDVAARDTL